ncbi:MAG: SRPBCC family protein [Acidimicrobiia bacterium]|nr:SRPBCC family protein [Acidimicrobiia bacterium]
MRYVDGPTVEVDVFIAAPAGRVWELVTDIELPARFSSELQEAAWVEDGVRFVGRNFHPAMGEWETTSFVSRREPLRAFAWDVSDPDDPSSSWWFELEPGPGGVHLRQGMRIGPADSGLTIAIEAMPDKEERIIERRLAEHADNMRATLEGIKALAEGVA